MDTFKYIYVYNFINMVRSKFFLLAALVSVLLLVGTVYFSTHSYVGVFVLGFVLQTAVFIGLSRVIIVPNIEMFDLHAFVCGLLSLIWLIVFCFFRPEESSAWNILLFALCQAVSFAVYYTLQVKYLQWLSFQEMRTNKASILSIMTRELIKVRPEQNLSSQVRFDSLQLNDSEMMAFVLYLRSILQIPLEKTDIDGTLGSLAARISYYCRYCEK